jgi:hypothetical protein
MRALARDPMSAMERASGHDIALHYNGEPVLRPGIAKTLAVSVSKDDVPCAVSRIEVAAPAGWQADVTHLEAGRWHFALRASDVPGRSEIRITVHPVGQSLTAAFTLLGPGEAQGYPCGVNVPGCPRCGARKEACVCKP